MSIEARTSGRVPSRSEFVDDTRSAASACAIRCAAAGSESVTAMSMVDEVPRPVTEMSSRIIVGTSRSTPAASKALRTEPTLVTAADAWLTTASAAVAVSGVVAVSWTRALAR